MSHNTLHNRSTPVSDRVDPVRLENEHLGNVDQYRATRDVPLPYAFDSSAQDSGVEDWDQPRTKGWIGRIEIGRISDKSTFL